MSCTFYLAQNTHLDDPLPGNPMMSCDCHWAARCVLFSRENLWARHSLALSAHSKKCGSSGLSWLTVICHFLPFGHLFGHNFFNRWPQKWNQKPKAARKTLPSCNCYCWCFCCYCCCCLCLAVLLMAHLSDVDVMQKLKQKAKTKRKKGICRCCPTWRL